MRLKTHVLLVALLAFVSICSATNWSYLASHPNISSGAILSALAAGFVARYVVWGLAWTLAYMLWLGCGRLRSVVAERGNFGAAPSRQF